MNYIAKRLQRHALLRSAADEIERLERELAEAKAEIGNARAAFGEHIDTPINLAERIDECRREGRLYFEQVQTAKAEQRKKDAEIARQSKAKEPGGELYGYGYEDACDEIANAIERGE